jgi:hypothetical protein
MKQLIEDLISAMEYHVEQTRPIHSTTVALQAAREALRAQPAVQELVECQYGNGGYACCEGGPCKADEQNNAAQPAPVQPPVADNLRAVEGLLLKFQSAVSNMARTHQEYMGKAMGDETYARFAKARDETIPALRAELLKLYTTPPAAQPAAQEIVCSTGLCHYKALPDAIHHTDLSEHPEYISGWNDYRQAMMEMMK